MNNTLKSSAVNYGLYCGTSLAGISVFIYLTDLSLMAKWWLGLIILLATIVFGMVSTAKGKSVSKEVYSFKDAFTVWFITILIGVLISNLVSIILFQIIDPEANTIIAEATIKNYVAFMEKSGATQLEIDDAKANFHQNTHFSISNILQGITLHLIKYSLIGLVVAAVMKRNKISTA